MLIDYFDGVWIASEAGDIAHGLTMEEAIQGLPIAIMAEAVTAEKHCAPGSRACWLSAAAAAAYLEIDKRTLLRWARQGQVRAYRLSGTQRHVWRFLIEDLDAAVMLESPTVLEPNRSLQ